MKAFEKSAKRTGKSREEEKKLSETKGFGKEQTEHNRNRERKKTRHT
jgi:hypothetical protein